MNETNESPPDLLTLIGQSSSTIVNHYWLCQIFVVDSQWVDPNRVKFIQEMDPSWSIPWQRPKWKCLSSYSCCSCCSRRRRRRSCRSCHSCHPCCSCLLGWAFAGQEHEIYQYINTVYLYTYIYAVYRYIPVCITGKGQQVHGDKIEVWLSGMLKHGCPILSSSQYIHIYTQW